MKTKILLTAASFYLLLTLPVLAQAPSQVYGGGVEVPRNTEPCLTSDQRDAIQTMITENIDMLSNEGRLIANYSGNHPLFGWPVAQASGFNYNNVWSITNFVDHDPTFPNQIEDYDCGGRSYDTTSGYNHQGIDIITWPFWWKQMDDNQAINVAAADGQIVAKMDGSFDRNCAFSNDPWNAVFVQHSDGSVSWYGHMKQNTLTSKNIGDSVVQGEYLGVIGSSGSSTAPHIHFEVYDSSNALIDPYLGTCNSLNIDSWWLNQKPYYNPQINAVLSHTTWPEFPACPATEITNLSNQFSLTDSPLLTIFLNDQRAGTSVQLKVTRPDNTIKDEWSFNLVDDIQISYWGWFINPDMEGEWTWEATYNGDTASHTFNVGVLSTQDIALQNTTVYPNPVQDKLMIASEISIEQVKIHDIMGRIVSDNSANTITEINTAELSTGIYFVTLTTINNTSKTIKIVKQ